jgi:hypothetical protein
MGVWGGEYGLADLVILSFINAALFFQIALVVVLACLFSVCTIILVSHFFLLVKRWLHTLL